MYVPVKRLQAVPGKRPGKQEEVIVGHLPLTLSRIFHLFLKNGGRISITVVGKRRDKEIGLEIPATYTFQHKKPSKLNKQRELLKDKDDKAA